MKHLKNLLTLIFLLSCMGIMAQLNYPAHFESFKKGVVTEQPPKNPLLDNYDVTFWHLDLEVSNVTTYISGNVITHAKVINGPFDIFVCELIDTLTVDSILVNGSLATFSHDDDYINIDVVPALNVGDDIVVQVYYHGLPVSDGGFFSGISSAPDDYFGQWVTWTLSESFHAKEWWPTKQDLQDKADSVWVFYTCADTLLAGSNGLLTDIVTLPDNKHRMEWKSSYPIVYYLISLAVAPYQEYNLFANPTGSDPVLIQNYLYDIPGYLDYYQDAIDETADMIELFSDLFGMYPFNEEKYGHCVAPLGGGMEHQTMSTMGWFSFWLIAHELGHMWYGDNVTCATWQDIWVNEGFASYSEYVAFQNLRTQADADDWMNSAHGYALGQPEGSVYIPFSDATNESRIFSYALSYKKGASLVHMLRFKCQDDGIFYQAMQDITSQFADTAATGDDIKEIFNTATGEDFTTFFDHWYYGKGFPKFDVFWYQSNDTVYLTSTQTTSSAETPLFETLMEYKINFDDGSDTTVLVMHDENVEDYFFEFTKTATSLEVDPNNWVLNEEGDIITYTDPVKDELKFTLYPNPARNAINFVFDKSNDKTIKIVDITGKVILEKKTSNTNLRIDISDLNTGVYSVVINDSESQIVKKLVVY